MFSPSVLVDVAREQHKDHLKEAQIARLLQATATARSEVEIHSPSKFNHTLELLGWRFRKQPGRI